MTQIDAPVRVASGDPPWFTQTCSPSCGNFHGENDEQPEDWDGENDEQPEDWEGPMFFFFTSIFGSAQHPCKTYKFWSSNVGMFTNKLEI